LNREVLIGARHAGVAHGRQVRRPVLFDSKSCIHTVS
jgi:hypothetical protein